MTTLEAAKILLDGEDVKWEAISAIRQLVDCRARALSKTQPEPRERWQCAFTEDQEKAAEELLREVIP